MFLIIDKFLLCERIERGVQEKVPSYEIPKRMVLVGAMWFPK